MFVPFFAVSLSDDHARDAAAATCRQVAQLRHGVSRHAVGRQHVEEPGVLHTIALRPVRRSAPPHPHGRGAAAGALWRHQLAAQLRVARVARRPGDQRVVVRRRRADEFALQRPRRVADGACDPAERGGAGRVRRPRLAFRASHFADPRRAASRSTDSTPHRPLLAAPSSRFTDAHQPVGPRPDGAAEGGGGVGGHARAGTRRALTGPRRDARRSQRRDDKRREIPTAGRGRHHEVSGA